VVHYCAHRNWRERRLIGRNAEGRREVSEQIAAQSDSQHAAEDPERVIAAVSHPPVLITEQEVAFSTAAAVALPRSKPIHRLIAALRAVSRSSSQDAKPVPRHYPPRRPAYLEEAAMAREMRRLWPD